MTEVVVRAGALLGPGNALSQSIIANHESFITSKVMQVCPFVLLFLSIFK